MKKSYYAIIPASVRYDEDLPMGARLLYGELTALSNEKGYCWATNSYFAELFNVTTVTISNWITKLEKQGHIHREIIYKEGTNEIKERRVYITPIKNNFNTPINNFGEGIKENFKENSTSNNTSIYISIFEHWNSKKIIKHRKLTDKMKTKIRTALKDYTEDEIKEIIDNYAEIVLNDKYWFNYKWTLEDFLQRGLSQFEDLEVAKQNYLKNEHKTDSIDNDPYGWMDIKE